jgi:hypothetical protein
VCVLVTRADLLLLLLLLDQQSLHPYGVLVAV